MNLTDLITSRANVTISITAGELATFANDLVEKTRRSLEVSIAEEQSEVFYSKDQVCRILSINPSTLWNWDKRDYLKPIKVGGMNRYKKSDIDKILGKRKG
jgi:predicted DNA-binding transcriptional regulator AlpA